MSAQVISPVAVRAMSRALVAKEAVDSLASSHEALLEALQSTTQRHHLAVHDFKTNFDTCHDEVCAKAAAAIAKAEAA
jgi:hypothetical protein